MVDTVTDPVLKARLVEIREELARGLERIDPHRRLTGRPVKYRIIAGRTLEITFRDVPSIDEGEVLGVKKLIGERCFCTVTPQTAETLTVRFVIRL